MNKMSVRGYVMTIAEAMNKQYGDTLHERNTDLLMAIDVLKSLSQYLYFVEEYIGKDEFVKWRKQFLHETFEMEVSDIEIREAWKLISKIKFHDNPVK